MSFIDQVSGTSTSTITVGTTITWVWVGSLTHSTTSTSPPPADQWDSGLHDPPFEFSHTFNTPGTHEYICTFHGAPMTGTVIVNP